ncbi:MAG TPA: ABC transporter ATP-binding protein [Pirellulales bacterium]
MTFELDCVTFHYPPGGARGGDAEPAPLLRDASLTIDRGSITAVVGESGVGKSTLLYLLGLLWTGRLPGGEIRYQPRDGSAPVSYSEAIRDPACCERLRLAEFGFALQSSYLLPTLTCLENVAMPLALCGMSAHRRHALARELIAAADPSGELAMCARDFPSNVSGGQRQRMALLRAVIHDPHVLFADEPVTNLDKKNANRIYDLLAEWHAGRLVLDADRRAKTASPRTLILVTHDLARACEVADHVIHFDGDGRLRKEDARTLAPQSAGRE